MGETGGRIAWLEVVATLPMRYHFGDFLDRDGGYWTVIPNRQRHAYRIGDIRAGSPEITIVTIGKDDAHWARVLTLPNLEELTLHSPTAGRVKCSTPAADVRCREQSERYEALKAKARDHIGRARDGYPG